MRRNACSGTCASPRAGQESVYRVRSTSYMPLQRSNRQIGRESVLDQRVEVVAGQPLAAAEEGQLDDEADAADLPPELLDEAADRFHGPARREHVVVDEHPRALRDQVRMQLERVRAVLELVRRADRLRRQLAGAARGNEAATDLARDRRAEDEAARLGAEDQVRLPFGRPRGEAVDRLVERLPVGEQ